MKISIVIVSHDEGPDLEATVALALASQPTPYEVIVVDDCSTIKVVDRMRSFPSVKVIRTPQQLGAGPAKRFGCSEASGDVFVILDSHMRMPSDWLSVIEDAVTFYPELTVLYGVSWV